MASWKQSAVSNPKSRIVESPETVAGTAHVLGALNFSMCQGEKEDYRA